MAAEGPNSPVSGAARNELQEALRPLLSRARLLSSTRAMAWTVAGTLIALVLVKAAALLLGPTLPLITTAILIFAAAASAIAVVATAPDALSVARNVETHAGLEERLSTALEHLEEDSVVVTALLDDALARAKSLDARLALPWRWPVAALVASVLAGSALFSLDSYSKRVAASPAESIRRTPVTALDSNALLDLAEAVDADARAGQDAYLAAVAASLREIGHELRAGAPSTDVRPALDAALEHLARAYRSDLGGMELAQQLLADTERVARAATAEEASAPARPRPPGITSSPEEFEASPLARDLQDLLGEMEANPYAVAQASPSEQAEGQAVAGNLLTPEMLEQLSSAPSQPLTEPADGPGDIIGAASESGAGASQLAGRGSQELFLEGVDGPEAQFSGVERSLLSGPERDEGRRIEMVLPTSVAVGSATELELVVGEWTGGPEASLERDVVPELYRAAAGRYFLPSQAVGGATR